MTEHSLGHAAMARLDMLADFSSDEGRLTRLYLSDAHLRAIGAVSNWMREASMRVRVDAVGNIVGRFEGARPDAAALLIGSHIDTVVDAGRYDGNLGVVTAIAAVAELARTGKRYPFAIEVIAFGDEEGVRFPSTLLGSRAIAGTADAQMLDSRDASGISVREALTRLDPSAPDLASAAMRGEKCLGYLEVHIEQGPVLEAEGLALGVVTAINGAGRFRLEITGAAGHSGTVPMRLRHDALSAAAEIILMIEAQARVHDGLVATVGKIEAEPGAVNVIPGRVRMTLDIRGPDDAVRRAATQQILRQARAVAGNRGVRFSHEASHDALAVSCDPGLVRLLSGSLSRLGHTPRLLPSGAGHDATVVAKLCPTVMLFVRCAGGISHNPAESVMAEDVDLAIRATLYFIDDFENHSAHAGIAR